MSRLLILILSIILCGCASIAGADQRNDPREQAISDALDLWRDGHYEQLYDTLSHRGSLSRERFAVLLKDAQVKPACCYQKLNGFRVISEKRTTAKVFAKLGMEGAPGTDSSQSREFTLDHEEGRWKMRLPDLKSLAGVTKKKAHAVRVKKYYH